MDADMHLYQIAFNDVSRAQVEARGFRLLDNTANERPDWYEYWPIRKYLLEHTLQPDAWYGFFSPKFGDKTQLSCADVQRTVRDAHAQHSARVVLFSPQPDMGANFLSVFEQAELFDAGFIQTAEQLVSLMGQEVPLANIVMDSRHTVFSNYFVARPAFWHLWLEWTEKLFACAEDVSHPLHGELCKPTSYGGNAQRKVFLLERIASLLLVLQPEFKTYAANPFNMGWSVARFRDAPENTYINDALKRAYRDTGFPQYLQAFITMRERFAKRTET
jgi:hypothetical protein